MIPIKKKQVRKKQSSDPGQISVWERQITHKLPSGWEWIGDQKLDKTVDGWVYGPGHESLKWGAMQGKGDGSGKGSGFQVISKLSNKAKYMDMVYFCNLPSNMYVMYLPLEIFSTTIMTFQSSWPFWEKKKTKEKGKKTL